MTFFDDILVMAKKLEEEIKEHFDYTNDWTFVAEEIKNWAWHCESYNLKGEYNYLIKKIKHLYNITKNTIYMERRFVLEFMEPIITELIRLIEKKKKVN